MTRLIMGNTRESKFRKYDDATQARVAVKRLREITGTFMYMQDKTVAEIFAKEKNRMGKMIGHIDKTLPQTPKVADGQTFTAWQTQDLETKWGTYMDGIFEHAKKRGADFMELNLKNPKKDWDSSKKKLAFRPLAGDNQAIQDRKKALKTAHDEIIALIEKTEEEWERVKNWQKPPNW